MTSSRFDLGSTLKTLNLSLLRFNERFGSENLGPQTSELTTTITNLELVFNNKSWKPIQGFLI